MTAALGLLLQALVAALALYLARGRRYHAPYAVYATALAATDAARVVLHLARPYGSRWALAVDTASWAIEPVGLAVAAAAVWAPRAWPHVAGFGAVLVALLCTAWPWGAPQRALCAVHALGLVVTWALFAHELRQRRNWPAKPTTIALVVSASAQTALLLGPWAAPDVWVAWPTSHALTAGAALALVALHVAWLADSA